MLTLLLLRHAKSDWPPGLRDHARPLADRGIKAAPLVAAHLRQAGLKPGLILCSDAVRTQATLTLVLPELGIPVPRVVIDTQLYHATTDTILERIRKEAREGDKRVMVIGHNPGLHDLALTLSGQGDKQPLQQLAMKFPTAALAAISFDVATWSDIAPFKGRLAAFVVPRDLE